MFTSFVFSLVFWLLLATALAAASLLLSGLYVAVNSLVKPLLSDDLLSLAEDAQLRLDERYLAVGMSVSHQASLSFLVYTCYVCMETSVVFGRSFVVMF